MAPSPAATDALTLAELVTVNPAAARVLDRFELDYCCRGHQTLPDACAALGLDAAAVADAVAAVEPAGDTSWTTLDATALADHIVETHHRYLWDELPLLDGLADKVQSVHAERHPELPEVRRLVRELVESLGPHLAEEEDVLFPAVRSLAATGATDAAHVTKLLAAMDVEHDRAGALLARLRATTAAYAVPDDACASYRSLYERLEALELDTHLHVHKENHVLFPTIKRAVAG
jgi:regulator of cell morphogenesis and NO signaling